jgi:hypothetical protein
MLVNAVVVEKTAAHACKRLLVRNPYITTSPDTQFRLDS